MFSSDYHVNCVEIHRLSSVGLQVGVSIDVKLDSVRFSAELHGLR